MRFGGATQDITQTTYQQQTEARERYNVLSYWEFEKEELDGLLHLGPAAAAAEDFSNEHVTNWNTISARKARLKAVLKFKEIARDERAKLEEVATATPKVTAMNSGHIAVVGCQQNMTG